MRSVIFYANRKIDFCAVAIKAFYTIILKKFSFDSAHYLPKVPTGHKCSNMHGHTYQLTLFVDDVVDRNMGWVLDFTDLKILVKPIIERLDHQLLNEIEGLENPTAENVAIWIWNRTRPALPSLARVELMEMPVSGVIYTGVQSAWAYFLHNKFRMARYKYPQ